MSDTKQRLTRNPVAPPPLWTDGFILTGNKQQVVAHLFTSFPTLPEDLREEPEQSTYHEIQATVMMDLDTARKLADSIQGLLQKMEVG